MPASNSEARKCHEERQHADSTRAPSVTAALTRRANEKTLARVIVQKTTIEVMLDMLRKDALVYENGSDKWNHAVLVRSYLLSAKHEIDKLYELEIQS